ncbi:MAG: hypothetical protein NT018_07795 [Armatimonadetes bacterium]|nr:hypothetical protein [Armatimonadota bacterium]
MEHKQNEGTMLNKLAPNIQQVAQVLATAILRLKLRELNGQREAVFNAGAAVAAQNSPISN